MTSTGRASSIDKGRGAGVDVRLAVARDGTALVDRDESWEEELRAGILKGRPGGRLGLDGERADFAILALALGLGTRPLGKTRSFFSRVTGASLPLREPMACMAYKAHHSPLYILHHRRVSSESFIADDLV